MSKISVVADNEMTSQCPISVGSLLLPILRKQENKSNILFTTTDKEWVYQLGAVLNILNYNLVSTTRDSINAHEKILYSNHSLKIKLLCNWTTSEDLHNCWKKMSNNGKWNSISLCKDDETPDYYIIINKPLQNDYYEENKTIVFRMEPDTETNPNWNDWYESKENFLYFLDLSRHFNNNEWHLGLSYSELSSGIVSKSHNKISSVVSSLYNMEGHKKRIDFIRFLQQNAVDVDVYGRDNIFKFENHYGSLPYHNKNSGILPYKYTFIAENCSMDNYYTEKIIDAILGESLCFYWGCKNITRFIDSRSFVYLNLDDFEESLNTVKTCIDNNEWEKRIQYIRAEKTKILNNYSLFPRIEALLNFKKVKWVYTVEELYESNCSVLYIGKKYTASSNFLDFVSIIYNNMCKHDYDIVLLSESDTTTFSPVFFTTSIPRDSILDHCFLLSPTGIMGLKNYLTSNISDFSHITVYKTNVNLFD
jgi:hypothetical protein